MNKKLTNFIKFIDFCYLRINIFYYFLIPIVAWGTIYLLNSLALQHRLPKTFVDSFMFAVRPCGEFSWLADIKFKMGFVASILILFSIPLLIGIFLKNNFIEKTEYEVRDICIRIIIRGLILSIITFVLYANYSCDMGGCYKC